MQDISSIATFLIACISETLFYGFATILFTTSCQTLLKKRQAKEKLNLPLIIASPFLFLFATIHIWGVWIRTFRGFVSYEPGPAAYFGLITTTEKTITQVGQVGAVVLADAMTIYRTFMVWNMNVWVIIFPSLTFIATVVCAAAFIITQHRVSVTTSIFSATVTKWTEAWLASSLVTTAVCTFLIIFKLLSMQHRLQRTSAYASSRSLTQKVLRIFVESAALYSINNLMYSVLYSVKLNPEAWFSGLDAPIASITFSLIIVRVESAVNRPLTRHSLSHGEFSGPTEGKDSQHIYWEQKKEPVIEISPISPARFPPSNQYGYGHYPQNSASSWDRKPPTRTLYPENYDPELGY